MWNLPMDDKQRSILEDEVSKGRQAKQAYDIFIKGYIEDKKYSIFTNFCEGSSIDPDFLSECKRLMILLNNMEQQVLTIIETGELASKTLGDENVN